MVGCANEEVCPRLLSVSDFHGRTVLTLGMLLLYYLLLRRYAAKSRWFISCTMVFPLEIQ